MSLYILEGPRNTGKTTVVKTLSHAFGEGKVCSFKFERTSSPPLHMTEFLMKYNLALLDSRTICVIDRFHLTEFVMRKLDKKVEIGQLLTTTSMIDVMLHHLGAVTYVLQAPPQIRKARLPLREDDRHRKPEWTDQKELDDAWTFAIDNFSKCKTKVMTSENQSDIDKIVIDIMKEQSKQTHLKVKWEATPALPVLVPQIQEVAS